MRSLAITLAVVGMLFAAGTAGAQAAECDVTYAATGGAWNEAANWQGDEVPTATQNVCIPPGHGPVQIPFGIYVEANRVTAESQLAISLGAKLTVRDATPGEADASRFSGAAIDGNLVTAGSWILLEGSTVFQGGDIEGTHAPASAYSARLVSGTLSGNAQSRLPFVNLGGDLEPGGQATTGKQYFLNGLTQEPSGSLTLDVEGPKRVDYLEASTGPVSIAGAIDIHVVPPFQPQLGEVWAFGKASSVSFQAPALDPAYRVFSSSVGGMFLEVVEGSGPAPQVTRLSAKKGPAVGGTAVTVTGSAFARTSTVMFGSNPAASVVVNSTTSMSVIAPPGTSGAAAVTVSTPNGQSAATSKSRFLYEAPTVSTVSPASGPLAGGSQLSVTGSGFALGSGTGFTVGNGSATGVNCASSSTCTMFAPAAARTGTVDVRAVVAGKRSPKNPPGDLFTYTG